VLVFITTPPPAGEVQVLGEGIVVPLKGPIGFQKFYHFTTLLIWSIFHITFITIGLLLGQPLKNIHYISSIAFILETPLLFLGIMTVAISAGEGKALWRYRENWFIPTSSNGIALPIDENMK